MKVALGTMQDSYSEQLVSREGEDRMTLRKTLVRDGGRHLLTQLKG